MMRKTQFGGVLVALVLSLVCISQLDQSEAQKTAQRWNNNAAQSSRPQSVYGGYQQQSSDDHFEQQPQRQPVAPVQSGRTQQQQRGYQSSSSARQPQRPQQSYTQQQQQQESSYESSASSAEADAEPASYGAVAGEPGRDFPAYTRVPKTSFSCDGLPYDYGMYADEETGCQAYHLCYNGRKESFLCGVGTVFNQRILHCDYWYSVDCGKSSQYYSSNAYMGSSQPEPGPAEANAAPVQQQQQQQQQSASSYRQSTAAQRPAAPSQSYRQQQSFSRNTQQTQESY